MYALQLSTTVIISGLATAATSYLLCMRLFKSATTRVLELSPPRRGTTAGVGQKAIFIYTLTTGVPMIGLIGMVAFANENRWSRSGSSRSAAWSSGWVP